MNRLVVIILLLIPGIAGLSQGNTSGPDSSRFTAKYSTVFPQKGQGHGIPLGYFFEVNAGFTMFGGKGVFLPGLSAGIILDHHWTIGASGSFIGNPHGLHFSNIYYDSATFTMRGANLAGGYGGLLLEYTLMPSSVVHVAFPLMIGGGYMFYQEYAHNYNHNGHTSWHHDPISKDRFFVLEPGVRLDLNLVRILRMGLTLSYRYAPGFHLENTSDYMINQFNLKLGFRLGKF